MIDRVRDYIKGSISFCAQGGFAEDFVNLCRKNAAVLLNLKMSTGCVTARTYAYCLKDIKKAAEQSGMTFSTVAVNGLPKLKEQIKQHIGIPIGLVLAFTIVCVLSSFIWSIEISCPDSVDRLRIESELLQNGIKRGMAINQTDTHAIVELIELSDPSVLRAQVNIVGCRLFIEISPRTVVIPEETQEYCNIVAAKNGEIIKADILAGQGSLLPGTPVSRGDLLVSGTVTLNDSSVRFVKAKADILARTVNIITTTSAFHIRADKITAKHDYYAPVVFYSLFRQKENTSERLYAVSRYYWGTPTVEFPFGTARKRVTVFAEEEITLSREQAILIALGDMMTSVTADCQNMTILERDTQLLIDKNITLECRMICEENIAKSQQFLVENVED